MSDIFCALAAVVAIISFWLGTLHTRALAHSWRADANKWRGLQYMLYFTGQDGKLTGIRMVGELVTIYQIDEDGVAMAIREYWTRGSKGAFTVVRGQYGGHFVKQTCEAPGCGDHVRYSCDTKQEAEMVRLHLENEAEAVQALKRQYEEGLNLIIEASRK